MLPLHLDPERYFPGNPGTRAIAAELFAGIARLPLISPHGHTDPAWFAGDAPFEDAVSLLLIPDHYLLRMLYSQGIRLEALGLKPNDGAPYETDRRKIWRLFAAHYHIFRGTPSQLWLDHTFAAIFGIDRRLTPQTADHYYDLIGEKLATPEFRPRALFQRFNLEVIATTEGALDPLREHKKIKDSGWNGRVITTFRPDEVTDPDHENFAAGLPRLGEITGEDVTSWRGYLKALENRRAFFRAHGATATDHGPAPAQTADLSLPHCEKLFARVRAGKLNAGDAELFRAQIMTEMARMSVEDGMVMQMHPGCFRNHNAELFRRFGRNIGGDMPNVGGFLSQLKPLLDKFGNRRDFRLILF